MRFETEERNQRLLNVATTITFAAVVVLGIFFIPTWTGIRLGLTGLVTAVLFFGASTLAAGTNAGFLKEAAQTIAQLSLYLLAAEVIKIAFSKFM
jgi:hypothetical protein